MKRLNNCMFFAFLMFVVSSTSIAQECLIGPVSNRMPAQGAIQNAITNVDEAAVATFWHEPCDTNSNNAQILLRVEPSTAEFGFGSDFFAIQDGYQYDRIRFLNREEGDRVNVVTTAETVLVEISDFGVDRPSLPNKAIVFIHDDGGVITEFELSDFTAQTSSEVTLELFLEEPLKGGTATGISNIRGWAVAASGIKQLEYFVDGKYMGLLPYGGERLDVEQAFPDVPNSNYSGFGQTFNYGLLNTGSHTITIRALSTDGSIREESAIFNVVALPDAFIDTQGFPAVDATQIQAGSTASEFVLNRVTLEDGTSYRITLKWIPATQSFDMVAVEQLGGR